MGGVVFPIIFFFHSPSLSLICPTLPRSFRPYVCVCMCVWGMWNVRWDVSNFLFLLVKYIPVGVSHRVCVWVCVCVCVCVRE